MCKKLQGLGAVAGLDGLMSEHLQRHTQSASEARVVVNHENVHNRCSKPFWNPNILYFARCIVHYAMPLKIYLEDQKP